MDISAKVYEKIAILHLSGPIADDEAKGFVQDLLKTCKAMNTVILALSKAVPSKGAASELLKLREAQVNLRPRILLVDAESPEADAKDLIDALDIVGSLESNRIVQLFSKNHELATLREDLVSLERNARELLGVPTDSPPELVEQALSRANAENQKLKYLMKTLSGEIEALKEQRTQVAAETDKDSKKVLEQTKKRALTALEGQGAL